MVSFTSCVVAAAAIAGILASPIENTNATIARLGLVERGGTPSSTGTSGGYYYSWWTDDAADATYTNGDGGSYSIQWSGQNGNLVGGKGWNPGTTSR